MSSKVGANASLSKLHVQLKQYTSSDSCATSASEIWNLPVKCQQFRRKEGKSPFFGEKTGLQYRYGVGNAYLLEASHPGGKSGLCSERAFFRGLNICRGLGTVTVPSGCGRSPHGSGVQRTKQMAQPFAPRRKTCPAGALFGRAVARH